MSVASDAGGRGHGGARSPGARSNLDLASPGVADVQATFCSTLVDEWVLCGVTDAVVCPGSRSTPLALALAGNDRIQVHVRLDERSAGFFALGLALQSGRPAVVSTTSGTAAAELHPAIVEAHHAGVAMIACTADRPPELHEVGAAQTIDQLHLFGRASRWFMDPGVPQWSTRATWRSLASRAFLESVAGPAGPGPVHLNLPFCEPLVGVPGQLPPPRSTGSPWHQVSAMATPRLDDVGSWIDSSRGIIVVGAGGTSDIVGPDASGGASSDYSAAVGSLASALGWPVLADPRSGCRVQRPGVVAAVDGILRSDERGRLRPDVVVRIGEPWASKVMATWLEDLAASGVPQVLVDPWWRWRDPARSGHVIVRADPIVWCRALAGSLAQRYASHPGGTALADPADVAMPAYRDQDQDRRDQDQDRRDQDRDRRDQDRDRRDHSWLSVWQAAESAAQDAIDRWCNAHPAISEPGLAREVVRTLPAGATLVVSSSMPVRDVECYGPPLSVPRRVLANRGVNGIDGVTSTALGVASAGGGPVVLLTGDLAFLHDLSSLVRGLGCRDPSCVIVVADNGGGGIFSFLDQARGLAGPTFEGLFGTPQQTGVGAVARGLGLDVIEVSSLGEVGRAMEAGIGAGGLSVVHVRLPSRSANVRLHDELNGAIAASVTAALA